MSDKINARAYRDSDYEEVVSWYRSWELVPPTRNSLPKNGAIVPGVCVEFLYSTDSDMAMLEGAVANRSADKMVRAEAMRQCVELLVVKAKNLGFSCVFGFTHLDRVIEIGESLGFTEDNNSFKMMWKKV